MEWLDQSQLKVHWPSGYWKICQREWKSMVELPGKTLDGKWGQNGRLEGKIEETWSD